jgi:hypothetical protein
MKADVCWITSRLSNPAGSAVSGSRRAPFPEFRNYGAAHRTEHLEELKRKKEEAKKK